MGGKGSEMEGGRGESWGSGLAHSAISCMEAVRIWISRGMFLGPSTAVCSDWYPEACSGGHGGEGEGKEGTAAE